MDLFPIPTRTTRDASDIESARTFVDAGIDSGRFTRIGSFDVHTLFSLLTCFPSDNVRFRETFFLLMFASAVDISELPGTPRMGSFRSCSFNDFDFATTGADTRLRRRTGFRCLSCLECPFAGVSDTDFVGGDVVFLFSSTTSGGVVVAFVKLRLRRRPRAPCITRVCCRVFIPRSKRLALLRRDSCGDFNCRIASTSRFRRIRAISFPVSGLVVLPLV